MKKYLFLSVVLFLIIFIYSITKINKKTYLILGYSEDSNYIIEKKQNLIDNNKLLSYNTKFINKNYRITDVINDIKYQKEIDGKTILNYIIKADYITINIGYNDFSSIKSDDNMYENIDRIILDLDELFILIRKYSKEEIQFLKIEVNSEIDNYIESQIKKLCRKHNIDYIS